MKKKTLKKKKKRRRVLHRHIGDATAALEIQNLHVSTMLNHSDDGIITNQNNIAQL